MAAGAEFWVPLIISAAGAATTAVQAERQNDANDEARRERKKSADLQINQLNKASEVEREKRIDEQRRIAARLRVASGESGLSLGGGTPLALQNQTQFDLDRNLGILDENTKNQSALIRSGARADINALSARDINPLLASYTGGLSGASTGLAIVGAIE